MRFGRLGSLAILVASTLLADGVAFAEPGGTPPASSDPSRVPTINAINANAARDGNNNGSASNGTRVGPKTVNPTYGPNGPGPGSGWEGTHQPREVWARSTSNQRYLGKSINGPVIAENNGKFYDARTSPNRVNGTINKDAAAEAIDREKYYGQSNSIQLYDWKTNPDNNRVAVLRGEAGKYNRETENGARIAGCVLCADAKGGANVGFIPGKGFQGNANFEAGAYLAKVDGNFDAKYRGDVVQGGISGEGQAFIGVQARGNTTVEVTRERVTVNGKIDVFAGGRASGQLTGEVGLTNVGTVKGTVMGEVSYGIGASAEGYFTVDWSTFTIKTGGRVSATLGIGAGVGFQTEISVKPAVDWVVNNVGAGVAAVGEGLSRAGSAVASGASWVASKLCFWCSAPPPTPPQRPIPPQQQIGSQVHRQAPTGPSAVVAASAGPPPPGTGTGNGGSEAEGAGMAGALGR